MGVDAQERYAPSPKKANDPQSKQKMLKIAKGYGDAASGYDECAQRPPLGRTKHWIVPASMKR